MFINFESSLILMLPIGFMNVMFLFVFIMYIVNALVSKYIVQFTMNSFFEQKMPSMMLYINLFLVILIMNVFGLIPSVFSLTSLPLMTLSMGLVMWASGYLYCIIQNYKQCVSHFLPLSAPMYLSVFLIWIEFVSWMSRPFALSVRLMANMTAGHLLMFLSSSGVFMASSMSILLFPLLLLLVILEVSVAFIQAYVYKLLLSLYMKESL